MNGWGVGIPSQFSSRQENGSRHSPGKKLGPLTIVPASKRPNQSPQPPHPNKVLHVFIMG